MSSTRFALLLGCAALAVAQQRPPAKQTPKQQRDLKIESLDPVPPPKTVEIPRSYAVVIGISRYKYLEERLQLKFPERDAQSIHTVLISPEGGNFKEENVHTLTGDKATLANIRHEINEWLPAVAKEGDRVLIYFAGHGFVFGGKGYLAPVDIDPAKGATTAYPMDELGRIVGGKIRAKSKILLTDSCHSGAITPTDTENLNHTLGDLTKSLFSLTASRDREVSYETADIEGGHGVFTYYVVRGMEGQADTSRDGIVTADELADYVRTNVREKTKGDQNPTADRASFDPKMLISYVPAHADPAKPPAPTTGTFIFEVNRDGVEVYLDGKSIGVLSKGKGTPVPGLMPGQHTVKGVLNGYEPDGPREETVYPGQDTTVSIKLLIARRRNKAALDLVDKGLEYYLGRNDLNYKKALEYFDKAFQMDPTYSQAAYYLGRTYNALFDEEKAEQYFRKAIEIDADYLEARTNFAGMLLDKGNTDEAIRQLNAVLVREPNDVEALTRQAQALCLKEIYPRSIEAAQKAIQLAPKNAEPHLWMANSLRMSGRFAESEPEYMAYLKLSDFDTKLAGHLNYYVLGSLFGMGRRKHAAEHDIWKELRSLAYFGLCDAEYRLQRYENAVVWCNKSLSYYSQDALAHYALGLVYMRMANRDNSYAALTPSLKHFEQAIAINPDLEESANARKNIATIRQALQVAMVPAAKGVK